MNSTERLPGKDTILKFDGVILADECSITRRGLISVLDDNFQHGTIYETGDANEAMRIIASQKNIDLLITNIFLQRGSAFDLLSLENNQIRKFVLADHTGIEDRVAELAFQAGATGYMDKRGLVDNIVKGIHDIFRDKLFIEPDVAEAILAGVLEQKRSKHGMHALSPRQLEVFELIARNKNTEAIAEHLGLSPKTVSIFIAHIKKKLQLDRFVHVQVAALRWLNSKESPVEKA